MDPELLKIGAVDQATLTAQFDTELKAVFPMLTDAERQEVAQMYPIVDAQAQYNTFLRLSAVYADAIFV